MSLPTASSGLRLIRSGQVLKLPARDSGALSARGPFPVVRSGQVVAVGEALTPEERHGACRPSKLPADPPRPAPSYHWQAAQWCGQLHRSGTVPARVTVPRARFGLKLVQLEVPVAGTATGQPRDCPAQADSDRGGSENEGEAAHHIHIMMATGAFCICF